jgi:hypothetical protein
MIHVGQAFVRDSLTQGLRAAFADTQETVVDQLPDNKYMISGWVDLITEQGRQDRQTFSVVVYKNDLNNWVGEKVAVIPQM